MRPCATRQSALDPENKSTIAEVVLRTAVRASESLFFFC